MIGDPPRRIRESIRQLVDLDTGTSTPAAASLLRTYQLGTELRRSTLRERRAAVIARATGAAALAAAAVGVLTAVLAGAGPAALAALAAGLTAAVIVLTAVLRPNQELRELRRQARDEQTTARSLRGLEAVGFRVLHDRRLRNHEGVRLPHMIIGPGGMFLLETRRAHRPLRWDGTVLWDGQLSLRLALERLHWMSSLVADAVKTEAPQWKPVVMPVSVITGEPLPPGLSRVGGVTVVAATALTAHVLALNPLLTPMDVAFLADAAAHALPLAT